MSTADPPHIALCMMVKDESARIQVSLQSVLGYVQSVVVYDTGSTDGTPELIKRFCTQHDLTLRLKHGSFVDFATSRNELLRFAEAATEIQYLLLLDSNDELRGGAALLQVCARYANQMDHTGFLLQQEWWSEVRETYYNIRLVKPRCGWHYVGRVHECLVNPGRPPSDVVLRIETEIVLYQDRTLDNPKSFARFGRDKELLLQDYRDDPTNSRTVFYLAQTCACTGDREEAYYYYKLATTQVGFWEETFHAHMRCGDLASKLGQPRAEVARWYLGALEFQPPRAEAAYAMAVHYRDVHWELCYTFADMACKCDYPTRCILFVDADIYSYYRWNLLAAAAWETQNYQRGLVAAERAYRARSTPADRSNLELFQQKLSHSA